MSDSDLDRLYRSAGADEPAHPSEATRKAILDHARQLAAARQAKDDTPSRRSRWRALLQSVRWQIAAPVAAAVLVAILLAPQWRGGLLPVARQTVAQNTSGAILQQAAPVPAVAPAPAPAPAPGPAPGPASNARLSETQIRPAAPLAAGAPPAAPAASPAARRALDSADVSGNAVQSPARLPGEDLRQAVSRGDLEQARALLRTQTTTINARDRNGRTALMLAVMHGQTSLVRELLSHGADPNIADASGRTPLAIAREENLGPLIAALLAAGAR